MIHVAKYLRKERSITDAASSLESKKVCLHTESTDFIKLV